MRKKLILVLILFIHILILSKLTFTAWPEMLSYPFLFSHGFALYKDYIIPYPPLLIFLLSFIFNIFGFYPEVLKIFTWFLILLTDLIIYLIFRRLTSRALYSFFFLIIFVILQSFFEGNMLWFDFATVLPLLISFYIILDWIKSKNPYLLFVSGFFLGLALLVKQIVIVYILALFLFLFLFWQLKGVKYIFLTFSATALVLVSFFTYLLLTGSLFEFWNWAIFYPLTQWSKFPGYVDFKVSFRWLAILTLFLLPLVGIILRPKILKDKQFILSLAFLIAALIAVYPRLSFFHLQPALAFGLIAYCVIASSLAKPTCKIYLIGISFVTVFICFLLFKGVVGENIRFYNQSDKILAQKIIQESGINDRVFILGENSSQYVFSNRLPPKHWSDNFGWYLEIPGVQEWMLAGLVEDKPKVIFLTKSGMGQWYELGVYQPKQIVNFVVKNYKKKEDFKNLEIWIRKD